MIDIEHATTTPDWAEALVGLVMAHEGIGDQPVLSWSVEPVAGHAFTSEGATWGDVIAVSPGLSARDERHTLQHELAHWVTRQGHTEVMYSKMFELVWLFGEAGDLDYARARECEYQPGPSLRGWNRFVARVTHWSERVHDYVELLGVTTTLGLVLTNVNGLV